jgi:hypothetical protein
MSAWYSLFAFGFIATGMTCALAVLAARWLLTGRRPRFMRRVTRLSACLFAFQSGWMLAMLIVFPFVIDNAGHRRSHTLFVLVQASLPVAAGLALSLMFLADWRGPSG